MHLLYNTQKMSIDKYSEIEYNSEVEEGAGEIVILCKSGSLYSLLLLLMGESTMTKMKRLCVLILSGVLLL